MQKNLFEFYGHVFNRKYYYTSNDGTFNTFTVPGGAAFIQQLLSNKGSVKDRPLKADFRCEHIELQLFDDKQTRKLYYKPGRWLGTTKGAVTRSVSSPDAPYAVLFDAGMGELNAWPDDGVPVLWASNKALPEQGIFNKIAKCCFLLLDADVIRGSGAMISSKISWERSATELVWQLQNNPALTYLKQAPHLLVTFAEDGAVYVKRELDAISASLVLAHGGGEGLMREKLQVTIDDSFALMTAALALQLPNIFATGKGGHASLRVLPVLKASESLMTDGYTLDQMTDGFYYFPYTKPDAEELRFEIPLSPDQSVIDPDFWCVSNNVNDKRIFDIACEYVMKGAHTIEGLPRLSYGALTTIDRREIESFRNVCNLIDNYAHTNSVRPLSIAVFGAPGSGKSFGVTQIAKNILPGKVEKLEFNVSQFTDNADLGAAFQKVRDVTLEGKLPLVFFDEFDSDSDGLPLGWVKSFLMPMQDGKFKDESGEHPIGKCILVFAGGTAISFEEFTRPMQSGQPEALMAFKNVKGPDFVSRLRGTIDVLGPNAKDETDKNYILRRALLLRSLCERMLKMQKGFAVPIDKNVLWAMLLVPKYKHGARSMEAILDMSRIEGLVWEPVSLPFYSQLNLHVDADAFIKLVLREVILNNYVEKLALAIHADFCLKEKEKGNPDGPNVKPWSQLSEDIRNSNRNQARDIANKLNSVGYEYDSGDTSFPSIEKFDEETVLYLARKEHDRWMDERKRAGWRYGPVRNNEERIHPQLVDWNQLPPEEQKKDINAVENIIPLLKGFGLRVYRVV